jgi:hypothetical protein
MVLIKRLPCLVLWVLLCFPSWSLAGGSQSESGQTLGDLMDYVEYMVDEDPHFTSGQILSYLNAAIQDVIWQTECMESGTQFTMTTGTSEYSLSGVSYFAITDVSWLESGATRYKPLMRSTPKGLDRNIIGEQEPAWFYERAGFLGVYPVEDADITGSTLYVTFLPVQDVLLETQIVPTPAALDQALVYYAAARCFARDKQWAAYQQMMGLYVQWIQRYRMTISKPAPEFKQQHQ